MTQEPTTIPSNTEARVLIWRQADLLSSYDAIERWRNLEPAVLHPNEPEYHLEDLALMTVAAHWLTRWQPIAIHRAILAGATPAQVCAAAGASLPEVFDRWQRWAEVQCHLMISGRPSVSEEANIRVLTRFADACKAQLRR
jgi:hypothetical protein